MRKILVLLVGFLVSLAASAQIYVNVPGDGYGWGDNGVQPVDNISTHSSLAIGTGGFKVKVWNGSDKWFSTGGTIAQETWITINGNNSNNMTISGASAGEKFKVEVDVTNLSSGSIKIRVTSLDKITEEPYKAQTVYFDNSSKQWSQPYAYVWKDTKNNGWPGTAMTRVGNTDYWSYTTDDVDFNPDNVIFSVGSNSDQSNGYRFVDGQYYNFNGKIDAPVIVADKLIHFDNSELKWEKVYAYLYNNDSKNAEWPGVAMTKGSGDIWSINAKDLEFDPTNVIFSDGTTGLQTPAEAFEADKTYKPTVYNINIKYVNQVSGWNAVSAYVWSGVYNNGWPGVAMTKGDNDVWSYTATLPFNPASVIFTDGTDSNKTDEAAFENGKEYGEYAVVEPDKGYIVGQFGDQWNQNRTDYPMEYADGVYTATYEFTNDNNYFLIKVGDSYYSCTGTSADNTSNGGEWDTTTDKVQSFLINKGKYTFTFTVADKKLKIEKEIAGPDYSKYYVKVVGDHNSWNWNAGGVKPTNGVATQNVELGVSPFQVCVWDGTQDVRHSAGKEIALNQWVATNAGNNLANTTIAGAKAGNTYKVEFNVATSQIRVTLIGSVVEEPEEGYTYLYFNAGNDWLTKYNQDFVPHCHVFNNTTNETYRPNGTAGWDTDDEAMENVAYQIWAYKVPASEIEKYNSVIFYVKEGDNTIEFNCTKTGESTEFDADNWSKYIYGIEWNGYTPAARQSYMTFDQFRRADSRTRSALFLAGDGVGDSSWTLTDLETLKENVNYFRADNGCFYIHLDVNTDASFKLSWINPVQRANDNGYTDLNNNRLWATFDLGLIGVDDTNEKFTDGTLDSSSVKAEENNCYFLPSQSMPYNHYNQFNWVVDDANFDGTILDPYIVVDSEEQTLTLIGFNPNPKVDVKPSEVTTIDLTLAQGKSLHAGDSHHMKACEANGHQIYDKVNVASGSVHITGASGSEFNNNFTVEYTVYMNDREMLKTETVDEDFGVNYMALGESDNLKVRARYISNATGLAFHSRTGEGDMEWDGTDLEAPSILPYQGSHIISALPQEDGKYNVSAVVLSEYTKPSSTTLAHYVDFEVSANGVTTAQIATSNISGLAKTGIAPLDWTPYNEDEEWSDKNSWTKAVHNSTNGELPIYIPGVQRVEKTSDIQDTPVDVKAYAVYPFLVSPYNTSSVRLAPRRAAAAPEDLSRYAVINVPVAAIGNEMIYDVKTSSVVTGIDTVEVEKNANAEPEYYTIQGIRVSGNLTPGIYIRRTGDKAEKVYIR